ncbi:MAG: extensin family protein [Pseudolabrys sp.]|nr:extensin family protein [Pseudolabrys sp.]
MSVGARLFLAGIMTGLLVLAGCGRGFFSGERAPWRHEAEVACMKSGAVRLGAGAVRIEPIEGPGMCGMDFPLRVSALGEAPLMSFADDPVPPAPIPDPARAADVARGEPRPLPTARIEVAPGRHEQLRWVTGPPPAIRPSADEPISLDPRTAGTALPVPPASAYPPTRYVAPAPPSRIAPEPALPDDIPPDATIPPGGSAAVPVPPASRPPARAAYNAPIDQPARESPRFAPPRAPFSAAAVPPAELTPPATLACPIVSALDRWVSEGVQPAALRWFGSPVVEIRQIGSYSCRGMVGGSGISEHAYGNALDIAAFTLADGRRITVKDGWHGSPEEQGFLHDVQLAACESFTTVLAPGYNIYHYNHIHVDLMRRADGRHPCRPEAIPGAIAAARARARYAAKHPLTTGSIAAGHLTLGGKPMEAVPGADGYDEDAERLEAAIAAARAERLRTRPD